MAGDQISLGRRQASLVVGGAAVGVAGPSELRELVFASAGTDVYATDVEFLVLQFPSQLWVVPEDTPGLAALLTDWAPELGRAGCFEAHCADLPSSWRKRVWFLALPVPRLGAHGLATLPVWSRKQAVEYARRPRPTASPQGVMR